MPSTKIVLSSRNKKKIGEVLDLLAPHKIEVVGVDQFPSQHEVIEDGDSFEANATKKAVEVARNLGLWTIAEDSGLCVDALGGAPGIYSARFAGEPPSDARNNEKLLAELHATPSPQRGAHYVCHAVVANPEGEVKISVVGRCYGEILSAYHGQNGFGYDPLFRVREYHKTFGELTPAVKRAISHRARAFEQLIPRLVQLLAR